MRMIIGIIIFWAGAIPALTASAGELRDSEQVYVQPEDYVAGAFAGAGVPEQRTLWPDKALRKELSAILGHIPSLRFRYWGAGERTVWILDEIGKDRPITAGVTIDGGKIEDVKVLVFRESRGWEIKHGFFTRQFTEASLDQRHRLSASIDNITGATLSVKAMTRMAKAALLMHQHTPQATSTLASAR